jgi:hypothetical protein
MKRTPLLIGVGVAALACCAQALALGTATATVNGSVIQPAGINIVSPLVMPTVTTTTVSATSGLSGVAPAGVASATNAGVSGTSTGATSATRGGATGGTNPPSPPGNATLTIHGQAGDAVSMAVPESFTVVRTGGTEALTVKTNTNVEYGLNGDGVVLGGTVMGGATMSVNVGGSISLASIDAVSPGAYEGLLVVVVQYN